jgi:hypothetical protein
MYAAWNPKSEDALDFIPNLRAKLDDNMENTSD